MLYIHRKVTYTSTHLPAILYKKSVASSDLGWIITVILHLTWQKMFYYKIQEVCEMSVNKISRASQRNLTHI